MWVVGRRWEFDEGVKAVVEVGALDDVVGQEIVRVPHEQVLVFGRDMVREGRSCEQLSYGHERACNPE